MSGPSTEPPEPVTPSGRVHWVGTGMSTGSGLGLVCDRAGTTLWGRTAARAEQRLAELGLTGRAAPRAFGPAALRGELLPGDVVVSMLPATEHPALLTLALDAGAHFVCSSYLSPGLAERADEAAAKGLVLLTECGLDPGIDHLYAHELVRAASFAIGDRPATAAFTSYCGSNPAVANDFRYRFSWAPRGVLSALLTPSRSITGGVEVVGQRPWESVQSVVVAGEDFEVYPNRDSVPFVETYHLPPSWSIESFVRGTMRLDGWAQAWSAVFDELADASTERVTELADELARAHPSSVGDYDRVVMAVTLDVRADDGSVEWHGHFTLDVTGDGHEDATARLVSTPLAIAIVDVVEGDVAAGLHQAADDPVTVRRWLDRLADHGIRAVYGGDAA